MTPPNPTPSSGPGAELRAASSESTASSETTAPAANLLVVAFDPTTWRVVAVEGRDAAGARLEAPEAWFRIFNSGEPETLDSLLRDAFEAGIACVLGSEEPEGEAPGSDEERELRRFLLRTMIEHSHAKRFMSREVLNRAIVATIASQAAHERGETELH